MAERGPCEWRDVAWTHKGRRHEGAWRMVGRQLEVECPAGRASAEPGGPNMEDEAIGLLRTLVERRSAQQGVGRGLRAWQVVLLLAALALVALCAAKGMSEFNLGAARRPGVVH